MKSKWLFTALAVVATVGIAHAQELPYSGLDPNDAAALAAAYHASPNDYTDVFVFPDNLTDTVTVTPVELVVDTIAGDSISQEDMVMALSSLQTGLQEYARSYLGTPYVWGAKGPKRFDCSGFTNWVFKNFGYDIGHGTKTQITRGEKVPIKDVKVGDLMFFTRPRGGKGVGHVGMVIDVNPNDGSLKFIHASSKKGVTIQQFPDKGYYNRRFLQARRVLDEEDLKV